MRVPIRIHYDGMAHAADLARKKTETMDYYRVEECGLVGENVV